MRRMAADKNERGNPEMYGPYWQGPYIVTNILRYTQFMNRLTTSDIHFSFQNLETSSNTLQMLHAPKFVTETDSTNIW